ncbi:DUF2004 domain-containing protein [Kitasatospora sp. NPDC088391]|uniref:DUF2004 domain-containing protein n=1 Tax=Kitasatospora sp. NPDC088391 TaxID=3364074 RepID=UPI0038122904
MDTVEHARFGRLETGALRDPDVVWEDVVRLGDGEVEVRLWAGPRSAPEAGELDELAARLADLPALDATARAALRAYLEEDRCFVDFHVEELADSRAAARLLRDADGAEVGAAAFVAAMRPTGIGLWTGGASDGAPVVVDYAFEPDLGDQLLAVKLTRDGAVLSVDWES